MEERLMALEDRMEKVCAVLQNMLDKIAAMDDEIDATAKLVNDDLIGGITNLYNTRKRQSGIEEMSSKYGPMMGPYKDFYSEISNGADIYEKLYDELEEFKQSAEGIDDAAVDAEVQRLADILKSKFEKIKGLGGQPEAAPLAVEVEVASGEPAEEKAEDAKEEMKEEVPEDKFAAHMEKIKRMRGKAPEIRF